MIVHCPVCDRSLTQTTDYMDHIRMGSDVACPEGHYIETDYTGLFELNIGDFEWLWTHRLSERGVPTETGVENATILARAAWRDGRLIRCGN